MGRGAGHRRSVTWRPHLSQEPRAGQVAGDTTGGPEMRQDSEQKQRAHAHMCAPAHVLPGAHNYSHPCLGVSVYLSFSVFGAFSLSLLSFPPLLSVQFNAFPSFPLFKGGCGYSVLSPCTSLFSLFSLSLSFSLPLLSHFPPLPAAPAPHPPISLLSVMVQPPQPRPPACFPPSPCLWGPGSDLSL